MPKILCFLAGCVILLLACNRSLPTPLASDKSIASFILKASYNSNYLTKDVVATISGDTIQLHIDSGTIISSLKPTIVFSGKTIDPANQIAEDFSKPLQFVVTAEDGTTNTYMTAVTSISPGTIIPSDKKILSFTFKSADNVTLLNSDAVGVIQGDSIFVTLPAATPLTSLKPFVVFSGKTLSPANALPQDFTSPVRYTVTATDGSMHVYNVKVIAASGSVKVKGTIFIVGLTDGAPFHPELDSGTIYALDAATGKLKWKYVDDQFLVAEPTAANGLVYSHDAHGNIFALDINTGQINWNYATGATQYYYSNTIVSNNMVYVCAADSSLYALNAFNGALVWKYKQGFGSPTVSNGMVYCVSGGIIALDANTGTLKWQFNPSSDPSVGFPYNPAVMNGILYVGCNDGNLYALDANTGKLLWNYYTGGVINSPTVVNGIVYFSGGNDGINALDANTGKQIWNYYTGYAESSSPTISNGILYCGSNDQYLFALDAYTGAVKWTVSDGNWIGESPLFFQGIIYVGAQDEIQAVDAMTGNYIWKFTDYRRVMLLPCAVDSIGHAYHTSDSGEQN